MGDPIPRKLFYKIGEVCQLTDTQPYVLRFWESEFPQLAPKKSPSGQRIYRRRDIDLVLEIKKLLYEEGFTIAGARKKLGMDGAEPVGVMEELFPTPAADGPAAAERPARGLVHELQEILRIFDQTDRRLMGRRTPRAE
jgi:DNA-binding transcriptional MerR regulator